MSTIGRRLERLEEVQRNRQSAPPALDEVLAALWPEDRARCDRLEATYAMPADSAERMPPDDYAALADLIARGLAACGYPVPEEVISAEVDRHRISYGRAQRARDRDQGYSSREGDA